MVGVERAENLNQLMLLCRGTWNRGHTLRVTLKAPILPF